MPNIYFSIKPEQEPILRSFLNEDPEIAYFVTDGENRWKAVKVIDQLEDGKIGIWHIPGVPLSDRDDVPISDPFVGWEEKSPGADPAVPYFGPGHPAVMWLDLKVKQRGGSSIEWIGSHYKAIGKPAAPETEKWWRRFRKFLKKNFNVAP